MHPHIIDAVDKRRGRVLAAELKIQSVARLDFLIDYFASHTDALAGFCVLNPDFDLRHGNCRWSQILERTLRAILPGSVARFKPNCYIRVLRAKRQSECQQQERCAEWTEKDFHAFAPLKGWLRVAGPDRLG